MSKLWSIARSETKQLWRRRAYWIVHLILMLPAVVLTIAWLIAGGDSFDLGDGGIPGQDTLLLYFFLIPALVSPAIIRDQGKPGELLWCTTTDPLTHLLGTFMGLWMGLLPGALMQVGAWWVSGRFLPEYVTGLVWIHSALIYLVAMTVALSLAILLATVLRRSLVVLILWAVLWVWLSVQINGLDTFVPAQENSLLNVYFNNLRVSPSLGLGPYRDLAAGMVILFAGVSLLFICLTLLYGLRTDRRKSLSRPWAVGALGLVALVTSGGGYLQNRAAVQAHAMVPSPFDIQQDMWKVVAQRMEVEVDPESGSLSGRSFLTLAAAGSAPGSQVVLRLNPGLSLESVRDERGNALPAERDGEGVIVTLAQPPAAPLTLELAWKGELYLPYHQYGIRWTYYDGPFVYKYYAPEPPGQLLFDGIGFLLRDGDWYPWPWSIYPHQAAENQVTIHTGAARAISSSPMQEGTAAWEGELPDALVAFPPPGQHGHGGQTIYLGNLAGDQPERKIEILAAAAETLAPVFGESPVQHVVALPYLGDLVWSGQMLLVPDGSGFYRPKVLEPMAYAVASPENLPTLRRSALYAVARTWLFDRLTFEPDSFGRATVNSERYFFTNRQVTFSPELWRAEQGRWVRPPELLDVSYFWTPRRSEVLRETGEFAALAFWLAMEFADPQVRQADLETMAQLDLAEAQGTGYGERARMIGRRYWPYVLETREARDLVRRFHSWTEIVGQARAIELVPQSIRQDRPGSLGDLMERLEHESGVPFGG